LRLYKRPDGCFIFTWRPTLSGFAARAYAAKKRALAAGSLRLKSKRKLKSSSSEIKFMVLKGGFDLNSA